MKVEKENELVEQDVYLPVGCYRGVLTENRKRVLWTKKSKKSKKFSLENGELYIPERKKWL